MIRAHWLGVVALAATIVAGPTKTAGEEPGRVELPPPVMAGHEKLAAAVSSLPDWAPIAWPNRRKMDPRIMVPVRLVGLEGLVRTSGSTDQAGEWQVHEIHVRARLGGSVWWRLYGITATVTMSEPNGNLITRNSDGRETVTLRYRGSLSLSKIMRSETERRQWSEAIGLAVTRAMQRALATPQSAGG